MDKEFLGIAATLIVLASFVAKKNLHIRIINAAGAVLFIIYGLGINSLSVTLLNAALVLVHTVRIIEHLEEEERKPHEKNQDI